MVGTPSSDRRPSLESSWIDPETSEMLHSKKKNYNFRLQDDSIFTVTV